MIKYINLSIAVIEKVTKDAVQKPVSRKEPCVTVKEIIIRKPNKI
jgi:hypothetical protein